MIFAPLLTLSLLLALHSSTALALTHDDLKNYQHRIQENYSEQLTNPQKKDRKSLAQFGYNLSYFKLNVFPLTQFINPHHFGTHSYGRPNIHERNGALYTCKGGFMDFSHIRAGLDWSVFISFTLLSSGTNSTNGAFELPPEAGTLKITTQNIENLSLDEITDLGAKIAFERLIWHETASWHYHHPNHRNEQQSAFSIEDSYSNFLGALIGKKVAMRLLTARDSEQSDMTYEQIATEEIEKMIASLEPMTTKRLSKMAYDIVDRHEQLKLAPEDRNDDVWWDSKIVFQDQRYLFKRVIPNMKTELTPWLVPNQEQLGCASTEPYLLKIPQTANDGKSLNEYYTFTITPDEDALFYSKKTGKLLHEPFAGFTTENFAAITDHVKKQMEEILLPGFDVRDHHDPIPEYKNVDWMWFHRF